MIVNELTDLIMDKFKNSRGYAEIDEKQMRKSITKYLDRIYKYDMEYTVIKLEHEKVSGKEITKEDYVREIKKAEDNLLIQAQLIAVDSKKDLKNLI